MAGDFSFSPDEFDALFEIEQPEAPTATDANVAPTENNVVQPTQTASNNSTKPDEVTPDNVETTKAFAKRLSERTTKAVAEEREAIAHQMGYASYDEMIKSRERQTLEDQGLDPDQVVPVVDKLVEERLKSNPVMQELNELRAQKLKSYADSQLQELTELTQGKITSLSQVPKNVLELWKTTGSLTDAYMQVYGKDLLIAARSAQSRGNTNHMSTPDAGNDSAQTNMRHLTPEEKLIWKAAFPKMTQQELDTQLVEADLGKKLRYTRM